jgi:hypothetical protein
VAILHPVFRAEVFEIDPDRLGGHDCHFLQIGFWQTAGQRLDDHLRGFNIRQRTCPVTYFHTPNVLPGAVWIEPGFKPFEAFQIVHPQAHILVDLFSQLACQPPGNANVAKVVDDRAENIPAQFHPAILRCQKQQGRQQAPLLLPMNQVTCPSGMCS